MDDFSLDGIGLDDVDKRDLSNIFKQALSIKSSVSKPRLKYKMLPASKWLEDEYYVGKEGAYIYPYWKNLIIDIFETNRGKYNEIILSGGIGCRPLDTKYQTSLGYLSLTEIKNSLKDHEIYVAGGFGNKVRVLDVHNVGKKKTKKVKFSNGLIMEATVDHRIIVLKDGVFCWCRFDELTTDTNIYSSLPEFYDVFSYGDGGVAYNCNSKGCEGKENIQFIRKYQSKIIFPEIIEDGECVCGDIEVDGHVYQWGGLINHNTGKSTVANIILLRKLYELSCYENISGLFDLMPSSIIGLMYFSVSKTQAELTGYGQFKSLIDGIPYFRDRFPREQRISSLLKFPENLLFLYGSSQLHSIGMNIIGTVLDEANFFQRDAQASDKTQNDYQKVSRMYSSLVNRGKSRFMSKGVDHSLSILVSSNTTSASFTEQRIEAALREGSNSHTKVVNARLWEVKPKGTYSDEVFWVFKGTNLMDPTIINTVEDINLYLDTVSEPHVIADSVDEGIKSLSLFHKERFIPVPIDFRKSFDLNISTALQDIAGVSVAPLGRLFNSRQTYLDACVEGLEHPFTKDEIVIATGEGLGVKDFLKKDYRPRDLGKKRYIHIDQSISNDSTGYASAYVSGWEQTREGIFLPVVTVDLKLRINPPKAPRKISLQKIVDFTFYMREVWGIEIGKLTQDSYASAMQLQVYTESGIDAELQSVDRTDEAYLMFTNMLYEGRIRTYRYTPEEKELFDLLHFRDKHRVDHPDGSCFPYETKIKMLDGTVKCIGELEGEENFELYGCLEDGKIIPVVAKKCFKTKVVDKLAYVTLDNGETIRCTPDHRFMLRNGQYCEAQNLKEGQSLMSLYYDYSGKSLSGYENYLRVKGWSQDELKQIGCSKLQLKQFEEKMNHEVVSVQIVDVEPTPVYDIEVPETSNFALASGIFVHNSKDVMDAVVGAVFNAVKGSAEENPGGSITRLETMVLMNKEVDEDEVFSLEELFSDLDDYKSLKVIKDNKKRGY